MIIPFGPFEPDKSPYNVGVSGNVVNALPVADGWGPMPGLTEISAALGSACRGAAYVRLASGAYRIVAGTETALFELDITNFTWTDITGTSGPYSVPLYANWTMTRFGNQLLIHNLNDPIQAYDIEAGGTVTDLAGSPPKAKYSWVSGDYLVLGNLDVANTGRTSVAWSGVNDATYWTYGKRGSDIQVLPEGDEVMGGFPDRGGFTVLQRNGMQFFPFAPSSGFTFTRTVLNPKQGTIAPRSIVSIGPGQFFYLSDDGFFGGVERRPIGAERIDRWFMSQIDAQYLQDVQGVADPLEKIIWWRYRTQDGTDRCLGYDWQLDRWCQSDITVGEMVSLTTPPVSWDSLDDLFGSIDDIPEAFDSRLFRGENPTFATFTAGHKLAYFTGPKLVATIDTAEVEIDGLTRSFISDVRVITDAPSYTVQIESSPFHNGAKVMSAAETQNSRTGLVPFRVDGRLHKVRLSIPAGTNWNVASAVNVNAIQSGEA
jgi:hypothetical protein